MFEALGAFLQSINQAADVKLRKTSVGVRLNSHYFLRSILRKNALEKTIKITTHYLDLLAMMREIECQIQPMKFRKRIIAYDIFLKHARVIQYVMPRKENNDGIHKS